MPEQQVNAGATVVIPANTIHTNAAIDNRHNVAGQVRYQIGAQPQVTIQMGLNEPPTPVPGVNDAALTVVNLLTSSVYVTY